MKTEATLPERLASNLELARELLLCGQYEELSALSMEQERLAAQFILSKNSPASVTESDVSKLKYLAKRNQNLITAAKNGVASVRTHLKVASAVRDQIETYDISGRRHTITIARTAHEIRS